jgi:hypothetical protein
MPVSGVKPSDSNSRRFRLATNSRQRRSTARPSISLRIVLCYGRMQGDVGVKNELAP